MVMLVIKLSTSNTVSFSIILGLRGATETVIGERYSGTFLEAGGIDLVRKDAKEALRMLSG